MAWHELFRALCLVLIIEGLLPFAAPRRWRAGALAAAGLSDRGLRILGFAFLVGGALLLNLSR
ncbi:MAG: DUF2065 domain-containing protein [Pseudomonadales bacterium]|nr:DUF2065 domain-containing protein [Pseudomonadales bacterium]